MGRRTSGSERICLRVRDEGPGAGGHQENGKAGQIEET